MASALEVVSGSDNTGPGFGVPTIYLVLGDSQISDTTTEATVGVPRRTPGTFSGLTVRLSTNTLTGSATITLRINGVDGNNVVVIAAGQTGEFSDTTHTDTIAAGDIVNVKVSMAGSNNLTITAVSVIFSATVGTAKRFITTGNYSPGSGNSFAPLGGGQGTLAGADSDVRFTFRSTGTLKNLYCYVTANTLSTSATVRSRVNGVNGLMLITIPPGSTGAFEDLVNSDAITPGVTSDYVFTSGGGTGAITIRVMSSEYVTLDNTFQLLGGDSGPQTVATSLTRYFPVAGHPGSFSATEEFMQVKARVSCLVSNLQINVPSNGITAASTFRLRINGVPANQSVTIPTSGTGTREDTVNSDVVNAGDELSFQLVTGGTGTTMSAGVIGMLATVPIGIPPGTLSPSFVFFDTGQYSLGA